MPPSRMTTRAQNALTDAQNYAGGRSHITHGLAHLLHFLIQDPAGIASEVLNEAGVDISAVKRKVVNTFSSLRRNITGHPAFPTQGWQAAIHHAGELAGELGDEYISTEHLLYGLVKRQGLTWSEVRSMRTQGPNPAEADCIAEILREQGLYGDRGVLKIRQAIETIRAGEVVDTTDPESTRNALSKYTQDLTALARSQSLDPVIGRDAEVRRAVEVLCRRRKNNPVLVGLPGVGKTVLAEALAVRIINDDVPGQLKGAKLLALDIAAMVAGAQYRGSFEERLKSVLKEIRGMKSPVIVFIDEIHNLVGAGRMEHGGMDASNMLKPALAKGELRCLGATTLDEYRTRIEGDSALNRRFQKIDVDEPSVPDTITILRGIRSRYEEHHDVEIRDSALVAAARLSSRYVPDRFLPDKAVDLLDEACASVRMGLDTKPPALDALERRRVDLKIEVAALSREADPASEDRLEQASSDLADLDEEIRALNSRWQRERNAYDEVAQNRARLLETRKALEKATRESKYDRAAELKNGLLPEIRAALEDTTATLRNVQDGAPLLSPEVDEDAIAGVVARWTGIPLGRLTESATNRLLGLEDVLGRRVVGQPGPIALVSKAIRRARAGLSDPNRPIGSFLFPGPTGVGKTETAKALADFLFDDEDAIIRLDMSEYADPQSISRLTGAAPGLVGYDDGGILTNAIRRKPYSVVLFDEIEKGHPSIYNLLLQILDEGRLMSSRGEPCNFRNAVIILTTNIGAAAIAAAKTNEEAQAAALSAAQTSIRPEIIGRMDAIAPYGRLTSNLMESIVRIQLGHLDVLLAERELSLSVTDQAVRLLAEVGFNPTYGARPLKQAVTSRVRDPLSTAILEGGFPTGSTIYAGVVDDEIVFSARPVEETPAKVSAKKASTKKASAKKPAGKEEA